MKAATGKGNIGGEVRATIDRLLDQENPPSPEMLEAEQTTLLGSLVKPLRRIPPSRSAAAEVALVICAYCLANGRPLNVITPGSPDLDGANNRLAGDRAISEYLSKQLKAMNVPATVGALQSSTYRAGYAASQAQSTAVFTFATWLAEAGRSLGEVEGFAAVLGAEFAQQSVTLPALPKLKEEAVDFVAFRAFCDLLLEEGSHGALEQYLCAGLLDSEMRRWGLRAQTKPVGVSDAASKAAGDIEIRDGQQLVAAYEISASTWKNKTGQVMANVNHLKQVTVVATGVDDATSSELRAATDAVDTAAIHDTAFLELRPFLDNVSSRLDKRGRCSAIDFVYGCLASWHRAEPVLCERLVGAIFESDFGLDGAPQVTAEMASEKLEAAERLRELAEQLSAGGTTGSDTLAEAQDALDRLKDL